MGFDLHRCDLLLYRPSARMRLFVRLEKILPIEVRVDLSCRNAGVAEHDARVTPAIYAPPTLLTLPKPAARGQNIIGSTLILSLALTNGTLTTNIMTIFYGHREKLWTFPPPSSKQNASS
jgi:hypothetical protein